MKELSKIFVLISYLFIISCASLQNGNSENQSDIINILLETAARNRDSIYVVDWIDKKKVSDSKKKFDYKELKILSIKDDIDSFNNFKCFLSKQGVKYDTELTYFKEQLKNPIPINKKKIKLDRARFFPANTDIDKLNFDKDYKFTGYYYHLPRIVFTRDGINAIIYQKNKGSVNHFTLFKKINGKWKGTLEFLDPISAIE